MKSARWIVAGALACTALVAPAAAQVNDDAKQVLVDCGKAMKENTGVTYKAKRYGTGMIKDFIDAEGDLKFLPVAGGKPMFYIFNARVKDPGKPDRKITMSCDGTSVTWLNTTDNSKYIRPMTDTLSQQELGMTKPLMLDEWTMPDPFGREFKLDNLVKTGVDNIRGEVCDIIEASPKDKSRVFTWAISVKDHLPRKVIMAAGDGAQGFSMVLDMWDVKTNVGLTKKDFDIPLPPGYVVNEVQAQAQPINKLPDQPVVEFGIKAGEAAPDFKLKDSGGKDVSLAAMKGSVVVLEFWGTVFKQSTSWNSEIQAIHEAYKGKNVKVIGLACRENNEKAAIDFFAGTGLTYTLIPKGDAACTDYKVTGFPSYYVVNGDGKVSAFFQAYPGKDKIAQAVDAAIAGK